MSSNNHEKRKESKDAELSDVLKKWLQPRIGPKLKKGLTVEKAWEDIVKDIAIRVLSPLPLEDFATAINRLSKLDDMGRFGLVEKLLTISPNPDCATGDRAEKIREIMIETLAPQDTPNGSSSIEIHPDLFNVARSVLAQSHRDWIGTREALSTFLKDCTAKYNSDRNVYVVYPHINDISRNLYMDKEIQTSVEYFFSRIQDVANGKGLKFFDLIKPNISNYDKEDMEELFLFYFPKGLPLENEDRVGTEEFEKNRKNRQPRLKPPLLRPRWHNQQHMMLLTLQNAKDHTMSRTALIDAALALDEKLSAETGLPRCFTGQTPRNSASSCLTTNADKYFIQFKKDRSQTSYYKLAFIPEDIDDAIRHYNDWMKKLIEHDWPLCFGRVKKNKQAVMLSVGASNPQHLRCRRCAPDTSCDVKLPSCSKCKSKGFLCIYPLRPGVHKERERPRATVKSTSSNSQNIENSTNGTKHKKKSASNSKKRQQNDDYSSGNESCALVSTDILLNGLDLSCVPKNLNDVVEIRPSTIPNAGNGLFAKRNLPMATPLGFYFGVPTMEDEFDQNKDKVGRASHYSMRYKHTILDATDDKGEPFTDPNGKIHCPFHFMNEDPFGNMVFLEGSEVNQVICWTKRDIKKGEELFVYYGGEVDREHWGQAEDISEPIVCAGDSEEDEIDFSDDDGRNEEEEEEMLYDDTVDIDDENINVPGTPNSGTKRKFFTDAHDISESSPQIVSSKFLTYRDKLWSSQFPGRNRDWIIFCF
ncbi:19443_t:CDS:2 [Dentiscutata erythropus]|uniref:19443_t:CDS:1 n=1 Tax=Dentiscutata erythropus TaxID=1348616 RepID=A0A9N9EEU2_9GLOM|nr:19443_t:CDS:2 [Dentiscutata erythropus]